MVSFPKYDSYKNSGVEWLGDIPEGWEIKRLNFLTEKIGDGIHSTPQYVDFSDYYFINGNNLINGHIVIHDSTKFVSEQEFLKYNLNLNNKTLLLSINGTIGNLAYYQNELVILGKSAAYIVLKSQYNKEFIYYYLSSKIAKNYFFYEVTGTTIFNLSLKSIKKILILLPPLPEQIQIAEYLDKKTAEIDQAISKKQRLIELLEEQKTIIINQAVTKGLNPNTPMKDSGVEWLGNIPEGWEVRRLKYLITKKLQYGANEEANESNYDDPRYIRITDFTENGNLKQDTFRSLSIEKAKDYLLEKQDLLFARSGATVGKTFFFDCYEGKACFAGYLIKASIDKKQILPKLVYLFTKSTVFNNWKLSILSQATIQNIGADKYANLTIPVPSLPEQEEIIKYLDKKTAEIEYLKEKTQQQIDKLTEFKQILIANAVTGKIKIV